MKTAPSLQQIIHWHYIRSALPPMLVIEVLLLVLYFGTNLHISGKNQELLLSEVRRSLQEITATETTGIDQQLAEISRVTRLLQADHQRFFAHPEPCLLPNGEPHLAHHANGAYYKTRDNGGASLYYSATTAIGERESRQARCSEALDPLLRSVVETHPLVTQAYINTHDGMNRLYPFMHDADERFGPSWDVQDLAFYVEADAAHNPERRAVWTSAYLDPAGQGWVMSSIAPVYLGDRLVAVSGVDITIDHLVHRILDLQLPWGAAAFLVDRKGTILAMPPRVERLMGLRELQGHDYRGPIVATREKPAEYNLLTGHNPVLRDQLVDFFQSHTALAELQVAGTDYLLIQSRVPQSGWRLMVMVDQAAIFAPIQALRTLSNRLGYLAIGGMLLFYLVFFLLLITRARRLAARLAAPIHALSEATSDLGHGLRNQPLRAVGVREIDALSDHFNAMVEELDQRTAQLTAARVREQLQREEARMLEHMATTDALTGIHNRRKLEDLLRAEQLHCAHGGPPFGVILCDIDHFKAVNDRYGHQVGDQVLTEMAGRLSASLRASDALGRWGGEEFIILCPGASLAGLLTLAGNLRQRIAEHAFPVVGHKTVSVGVALAQPGDLVEDVIARADRALYAAKAGGRNRVESA